MRKLKRQAQAMSKDENCKIDMVEKLFSPYGLVRYGVAPDHQKTKNITMKEHSA